MNRRCSYIDEPLRHRRHIGQRFIDIEHDHPQSTGVGTGYLMNGPGISGDRIHAPDLEVTSLVRMAQRFGSDAAS